MGGEVDVEGDVAGAEVEQPVEDLGMHLARPGPDAHFRQAAAVDLDEHQLAARRPAQRGEAEVPQQAVERGEDAEPACEKQQAGQYRRNHEPAETCHEGSIAPTQASS